jgi:hypothetical protein
MLDLNFRRLVEGGGSAPGLRDRAQSSTSDAIRLYSILFGPPIVSSVDTLELFRLCLGATLRKNSMRSSFSAAWFDEAVSTVARRSAIGAEPRERQVGRPNVRFFSKETERANELLDRGLVPSPRCSV